MVVGGVAMSAWGGFQEARSRRIAWLDACQSGRQHYLRVGPRLAGLDACHLLRWACFPLINGSNQAIWQAKVAPDVQGRVFSARRLIAWFTNPISPIIGGTLADFVLEPAMKAQTSGLAQLLGPVFGTGPGAGMSVLMVICGIGGLIVGLTGYFVPAIRHAETRLPDYESVPVAETSGA